MWYWLENMWLFSEVPEGVTAQSLWTDIQNLPGLDNLYGIAFQVTCEMPYWGMNKMVSWAWMRESWGSPMPDPPPVHQESAG